MDTPKLGSHKQERIPLKWVFNNPVELNLSYMPFILGGGLFVPDPHEFSLGDTIDLELHLTWKNDISKIEGKVVWITPKNAMHQVLPGIGIQFVGPTAKVIKEHIEAQLDLSVDVGGYTYGMTESSTK